MNADQMWAQYCEVSGTDPATPHDVWKFCDGGLAADELADLVLLGRKTATSSALVSFGPGEEVPSAGTLSVICRDSGEAVLVIRDTRVSVVPFDEVSDAHAFKEGGGLADACRVARGPPPRVRPGLRAPRPAVRRARRLRPRGV